MLEMSDLEYKKHLMNRACQYLGDNYILYRIHRETEGSIFLFEEGQSKKDKAVAIYNPYEATLTITKNNKVYDPCIKENVIVLFNKHFGKK